MKLFAEFKCRYAGFDDLAVKVRDDPNICSDQLKMILEAVTLDASVVSRVNTYDPNSIKTIVSPQTHNKLNSTLGNRNDTPAFDAEIYTDEED